MRGSGPVGEAAEGGTPRDPGFKSPRAHTQRSRLDDILDVRDTAKYLETITPDSPEAKSIIGEVYERRFAEILCKQGSMGAHIWVYTGPRGDYLLVPRSFCSCKDFMIRTASTKKTLACKHLIGLELAVKLGKKREVSLSADECVRVVFEILEKNVSPTLRKALYTLQE